MAIPVPATSEASVPVANGDRRFVISARKAMVKVGRMMCRAPKVARASTGRRTSRCRVCGPRLSAEAGRKSTERGDRAEQAGHIRLQRP
jgi:hypothetical protein